MAEIITATFQDGAFVPEQAVDLQEGTRVRLTIEFIDESAGGSVSISPPSTGQQSASE